VVQLSRMDCYRLHGVHVAVEAGSKVHEESAAGPFFWLVPLATIVLPVIAAKRESKWWWAVTAVAIITLFAFLRAGLRT